MTDVTRTGRTQPHGPSFNPDGSRPPRKVWSDGYRAAFNVAGELMTVIRPIVEAVHAVLHVSRVIGFALVIPLLCGLLLILPDQLREAFRVLGESSRQDVVFILLTLLASLTAWYWARVLTDTFFPEDALQQGTPEEWWERRAIAVLPRVAGTLPMFFAFVGLFMGLLLDAAPTYRGGPQVVSRLRLLLGITGLLTVLLPVFYVVRRKVVERRTTERLERATQEAARQGTSARKAQMRQMEAERASARRTALLLLGISLAVSTVIFGAVVVEPVAVVDFGGVMNPVTLIEIASASWVAVSGLLIWIGKSARLPILTTVILLAIIFSAFNLNDNHEVQRLATPAPATPRLDSAFGAWMNGRQDATATGAPYPVFVVAAEGGGIRAAYITAQILGAIQDRCPAFAQHVFAISGVSGGSAGGALFAALTARLDAPNAAGLACDVARPTERYQAYADTVLHRDLLSPVVAMFVYPDLLQRFLFFPVRQFDRARALEDGFSRGWRSVFPDGWGFDSSFYELGQGRSASRSVPALFLNTTQVENGARVVLSSVRPDPSVQRRLTTISSIDPTVNMSMSTAVGLSARFTYVTPEGRITLRGGKERHRYVDGGYFENSGAATATDIVYAMQAWSRATKRNIRPVVLRIGYFEGADSTRSRIDRVGFSDLLSPIVALLNTRGTRGDVVVAQLRADIAKEQQEGAEINMIDLLLPRSGVPLILGWLLSDNARTDVHTRTTARACNAAPTGARQMAAAAAAPEDSSALQRGYCAVFAELRPHAPPQDIGR